MHGVRLRTAAVGAAAAAALVAGCGSGSGGSGGPAASGTGSAVTATAAAASAPGDNGVAGLPADQALQRAVQGLRDAGAVRTAGTLSTQGARIRVDLRLNAAGDCTGTLGQLGVGSFEVVKAGPQLWVRPDQEFWQTHGGSAMSDRVGDRYLRTTSDNPDFAEITELCDLTALADRLGSAGSGVTRGEPATVQGRPALALSGGSGTGTLYVATTGAPVPLELEQDTGKVEFSEFGTPVPSATPGPDQSLDLDQLESPAASPSVV
ncbi:MULTISPECIES: hypothetical protein [unclassified Kitasatospora]|uniref:hypothetical protein n=1 Tax=unclassified Kitasatospora TaxID=2633591 RepID=UPI0037F2B487